MDYKAVTVHELPTMRSDDIPLVESPFGCTHIPDKKYRGTAEISKVLQMSDDICITNSVIKTLAEDICNLIPEAARNKYEKDPILAAIQFSHYILMDEYAGRNL